MFLLLMLMAFLPMGLKIKKPPTGSLIDLLAAIPIASPPGK
jgi:hypothetical protein